MSDKPPLNRPGVVLEFPRSLRTYQRGMLSARQEELEAPRDFEKNGTLAAWQAGVARLCVGNPVLILATCAALAGPLLLPLRLESGGFHLFGATNCGKSRVLDVAASVWGLPLCFRRSWDINQEQLEALAPWRNDTLLVLDDLWLAPPRFVSSVIYSLANGMDAGLRLLTLSAGVTSLAQYMESDGVVSMPSRAVRLLDVSADRRFGVLDSLYTMGARVDGVPGHNRFIDQLSFAASRNHGHAGPAFVEHLIRLRAEPGADERLQAAHASLLQNYLAPSGAHGRAATRFALAALAGELATDAGLLPWPKGVAQEACQELYEAWASNSPHFAGER